MIRDIAVSAAALVGLALMLHLAPDQSESPAPVDVERQPAPATWASADSGEWSFTYPPIGDVFCIVESAAAETCGALFVDADCDGELDPGENFIPAP